MAKPVEIQGETALAKALVGASGRIERESRKALSKTGTEVRRRMKAAVPKRSGSMAASITMQSRGTKWYRSVTVGPETRRVKPATGDNRPSPRGQLYPIFVEYGTAHTPAQPYVEQSLEGAAERLTARLNAIMVETI